MPCRQAETWGKLLPGPQGYSLFEIRTISGLKMDGFAYIGPRESTGHGKTTAGPIS